MRCFCILRRLGRQASLQKHFTLKPEQSSRHARFNNNFFFKFHRNYSLSQPQRKKMGKGSFLKLTIKTKSREEDSQSPRLQQATFPSKELAMLSKKFESIQVKKSTGPRKGGITKKSHTFDFSTASVKAYQQELVTRSIYHRSTNWQLPRADMETQNKEEQLQEPCSVSSSLSSNGSETQ